MNAIIRPQLSDQERRAVRKRVLEYHRSNSDTVLEALQERHDWLKPFILGDAVEMEKQMNKVLSLYLEKCGKYAEAEQDELDAIARGIF